jgi:hypothetical protein
LIRVDNSINAKRRCVTVKERTIKVLLHGYERKY